ncbi:MAG: hypothetical protein ACXWKP_33235 [Bradyrhizobium sp.]
MYAKQLNENKHYTFSIAAAMSRASGFVKVLLTPPLKVAARDERRATSHAGGLGYFHAIPGDARRTADIKSGFLDDR